MPASRRAQPTLTGAFVWLTAGTVASVGLLLYGFLDASRQSILGTANELRRGAARQVESAVARYRGVAEGLTESIQDQVRLGVIDPDDRVSLEKALFAALVDKPILSDAAFTRASTLRSDGRLEYDDQGDLRVAPDGRWEVAVYRAVAEQPSGILTRFTERGPNGVWTATIRDRRPGDAIQVATDRRESRAVDPTERLTFIVATDSGHMGSSLWSDLHWSELDMSPSPRVVVTVQRAVDDVRGRFAGVVRVGLLANAINQATRVRVTEASAEDPHRVFLCDAQGRLVSRLGPRDVLEEVGNDLRFTPVDPPADVAAALRRPELARAAPGQDAAAQFSAGGVAYLATFRHLGAQAQDWIVGVVVPERFYTEQLQAVRNRFLALYLAVALVALTAGVLAARAVRQGLRSVDERTTRMRSFDFAPAPTNASFRDVETVLDSLERAKTAMRALAKYTPLDLVKELVRANAEPKLGGRLAEVTVMFTDIQGFTSLAERVSPDELADLLGAYLEAMTGAIRATGGTIDKFIGDAVMALWNAPAPVDDHAARACRAVLACKEATRALYSSPRWRGHAPLVTRFGVHSDRVLVGHFGAPERMSYTALGDGVNLAARLEALCKQYEVTALVSDSVAQACGEELSLRRIDKVAVKGKSVAVVVYELLGPAGTRRTHAVIAYEEALDDYFARRFEAAIERLAPHADGDGPSRVLLARCRELGRRPPPDDWSGVYVATSK